jgi:hypothetical protein
MVNNTIDGIPNFFAAVKSTMEFARVTSTFGYVWGGI